MTNCVFLKQKIENQFDCKDFVVFVELNSERHVSIGIATAISFRH